ncbi:hypothetical protein OAO87_02770 [bacterium]|nr:hypothetical protein [bacterium]
MPVVWLAARIKCVSCGVSVSCQSKQAIIGQQTHRHTDSRSRRTYRQALKIPLLGALQVQISPTALEFKAVRMLASWVGACSSPGSTTFYLHWFPPFSCASEDFALFLSQVFELCVDDLSDSSGFLVSARPFARAGGGRDLIGLCGDQHFAHLSRELNNHVSTVSTGEHTRKHMLPASARDCICWMEANHLLINVVAAHVVVHHLRKGLLIVVEEWEALDFARPPAKETELNQCMRGQQAKANTHVAIV